MCEKSTTNLLSYLLGELTAILSYDLAYLLTSSYLLTHLLSYLHHRLEPA